jgi:hypothetical protein
VVDKTTVRSFMDKQPSLQKRAVFVIGMDDSSQMVVGSPATLIEQKSIGTRQREHLLPAPGATVALDDVALRTSYCVPRVTLAG